MNVYVLGTDCDKYRGIHYANDADVLEFHRRFDGRSLKYTWTGKEKFGFVQKRFPKGDTPSLSTHIPVFNLKAAKVLMDFLEPNGELLPITCNGESFFLFNVTRIVDALDEPNCKLERFDDGGVMYVDEYAFLKEKLAGETVFKLPQLPLGWVYVTDPFVKRVRAAILKGFEFRHVWSSE